MVEWGCFNLGGERTGVVRDGGQQRGQKVEQENWSRTKVETKKGGRTSKTFNGKTCVEKFPIKLGENSCRWEKAKSTSASSWDNLRGGALWGTSGKNRLKRHRNIGDAGGSWKLA